MTEDYNSYGRKNVPGWEGSIGPFPSEYNLIHVYARSIHSGAGNCVCGRGLWDSKHIQPAPGIEFPKNAES